MGFFSFIRSKTFFKQLGLALVVFIVLIMLIIFLLNWYTGHNKTIAVPNLIDLQKEKIDSALSAYDLKYVVIDSVYDNKRVKGSVVDQAPEPGFHVKAGRTVYITVVAMQPQRVKMPNLVDLTLRQATQRLETYGLKVGKISYEPDVGKAILKQRWKGKTIHPDSLIVKGSSVDLVVGAGSGNSESAVPYFINYTPEQAEDAIRSNGLLPGVFIYDADVKDSLKARVYRQRPAYAANSVIKPGMPVDLWFTGNEEKINYDPSFDKNPIDEGEMIEGGGDDEDYDDK